MTKRKKIGYFLLTTFFIFIFSCISYDSGFEHALYAFLSIAFVVFCLGWLLLAVFLITARKNIL